MKNWQGSEQNLRLFSVERFLGTFLGHNWKQACFISCNDFARLMNKK